VSRVRFFFRWYDLWIGAYYDRDQRALYVCPLPMLGVRFGRSPAIHLAGMSEAQKDDALW
jgi:hypothetical protein